MEDQITFTTPIKHHIVIIRGWMTGRDELAIQQAIQEKLSISMGVDQVAAGASATATGTMLTAGQDKALEIMLVSIDGKTDDLVNQVLDMHREDYRFVKAEIDKVTGGMSEEKKAESPDKPSQPVAAAPAPLTES